MRNSIIGKRLFGFIVLVLLINGAIHAQNFKFDSYFNSGLGVVYSDDADTDTMLKAFGVDSEQNGYRFRLNGSFSTDAGIAGIRFRFQSQSSLYQTGYFSMPYVYGWIKLFDDILYMAGGIVDDSAWQTRDWWINDDAGEGLGVMLRVQPILGLNLGAGAYIISQQAGGNNNILQYGRFLPNFGDVTPRIEDAKYVFGASYAYGNLAGDTLEEIFYLGLTFRMKNMAGWEYTYQEIEQFGYYYEGRQESAQLIGEFRFLGVEGLTAVAAVSLDRLEEFSANGNIILSETFSYQFGRTILGFNAAEFIYNRESVLGKKLSYDPGLLFNLWGSYTYVIIEPRLDLVYFWGGMSRVAGKDNEAFMWYRRGFNNNWKIAEYGSDNSQNFSVFSIRPSVKFNLLNRTFVEFGNMFNYDFGNFDGAYSDSEDLKKRSRISNVFYIDLRWSF
ncbi:MAG: hypothetical protein FWC24_01840 [Treponema sp.]|nr:hypothetical protein [Treponema sp.]